MYFVHSIVCVPDYNNHAWTVIHNKISHNWPHEERPSLKEIAELLEREKDERPLSITIDSTPEPTLHPVPVPTPVPTIHPVS